MKLPDPKKRAYNHGLGTLSVDGELMANLASVVGELRITASGPWPWFVIVWPDGTKENSFEDYGPWWPTVRELDSGRLEHSGPSTRTEKRFLGMRFESTRRGQPCVFDFAWLPADEAAQKWRELGLQDSEF